MARRGLLPATETPLQYAFRLSVRALLFVPLWPGVLGIMRSRAPLDAAWFGSFAASESNYDEQRDPAARGVPGDWEPKARDPGRDAARFDESPSGGDRQAWQTHYPALTTGVAGRGGATGAWHATGGGRWEQDHAPLVHAAARAVPEWFESSIGQYDGFGRPKLPDAASAGRLISWQERSVNTTLACAEIGCTASAMIQAFDPATEEASHCKLSLSLHPTDFDDGYSGERLTWIRVNGRLVATDCFPMISGCNATTQLPLYPCLQDLPLDGLDTETGAYEISAQISDAVDECPFEGNLLASVPMVTCLVAPKLEISRDSAAPAYPVIDEPEPAIAAPAPTIHSVVVPLRCAERGCEAAAHVAPLESDLEILRSAPWQCLLGVTIHQTDYDNEDGSVEQLDFLRLGNVTVLSEVVPGQNPCRSMWGGTSMSLSQTEYDILNNQDVTEDFRAGNLWVTAKISEDVDECAHDGYLLHGFAEVVCNPIAGLVAAPTAPAPAPPSSTSLPPMNTTPAGTIEVPGVARVVAPPPTNTSAPTSTSSPPTPTAPPPAPTPPPPTPTPPPPAPTPPPPAPTPPPPAPEVEVVEALSIAPFGREDTGVMLDQESEKTQDTLVDTIEGAQAAEIKRSAFRALTRLRAAVIKEYDTIARMQAEGVDAFNDDHQFRNENPLIHIHDNEPPVPVDRFASFHDQ